MSRECVSQGGTRSPDTVDNAFTTKKVGDMTYRVKVHFSEDATETMQEKLERILRNEVLQTKECTDTG